jgi:glutamate synthase domain-containing protein 2
MSYGAISDNAILALNKGAKIGNFYHNTGEGGVSRFHLQGMGDIVWNIGTGYFGCGVSGVGSQRIFDPQMFQSTIEGSNGQIKMIEIKLSQGAKPGHGGLLPRAKVTQEIASARKIDYPPTSDCHSPARHSEFSNAKELIQFIMKLRTLSGGLPIGIKMCVGDPSDVAALCKAIVEMSNGPDFITVDGAEGGTGAAPPELSNSVGLPLEEGLVLVRNMLIGAGLKDKIAIVASGRISSGFSIIRTIALGADVTCAARAFMLSLGCIQALKCNTNKCPTGIATLNKDLMFGLDPEQKSVRG